VSIPFTQKGSKAGIGFLPGDPPSAETAQPEHGSSKDRASQNGLLTWRGEYRCRSRSIEACKLPGLLDRSETILRQHWHTLFFHPYSSY
jgi:hypothetical protein